jgi:predicted glycoside hydrolase/deacetylase ChbG (UPF0249 family)
MNADKTKGATVRRQKSRCGNLPFYVALNRRDNETESEDAALATHLLRSAVREATSANMARRHLLGLALLCPLALAQTKAQATNTATRLGYPADAKLLIVHADDLAVSHSQDRASFAALDRHAASAASIMVPCPWLTEVAEYAKMHPDADLGLHLTLTSEWKSYRWGPVASRNEVPGLLGPDGNLWPDVPFVTKHATATEVEKEIRAQIDLAMKVGIRPTHLDSHMGTLFDPAYFPVYVKVARDYGLPFLAARAPGAPASLLALLKGADILPDAIMIAGAGIKPENWASYYLGVVRSLKPGLTELIVHLAYDDAEMQAVTEGHPDYGSAWRQRDFDVITSPEFRQALLDNRVTLVGWKAIKELAKPH